MEDMDDVEDVAAEVAKIVEEVAPEVKWALSVKCADEYAHMMQVAAVKPNDSLAPVSEVNVDIKGTTEKMVRDVYEHHRILNVMEYERKKQNRRRGAHVTPDIELIGDIDKCKKEKGGVWYFAPTKDQILKELESSPPLPLPSLLAKDVCQWYLTLCGLPSDPTQWTPVIIQTCANQLAAYVHAQIRGRWIINRNVILANPPMALGLWNAIKTLLIHPIQVPPMFVM
jgi:hypothetical protein